MLVELSLTPFESLSSQFEIILRHVTSRWVRGWTDSQGGVRRNKGDRNFGQKVRY